ncbi:hypothetical protein QBC40DRAFT_287496 [Triangularia verruculosa]|uniref:Xylanolytic transcriptional activator regulatory domain-containing protein n=1 Tax=Triangularia verruculosa TaxID=2587418 RepID=A0AAN6X9U8_9PEZI|nr:hypothetical protein QBC40DRAFT_287496 [Triangularia verruculosa]
MAAKPVVFVATDSSGLPVKRKQAHQACDTCRKRKKRCGHLPGNTLSDESSIPETGSPKPSPNRQPQRTHEPSQQSSPKPQDLPDADVSNAAAELLLRFFSHARDKPGRGDTGHDGAQRKTQPVDPAPRFLGETNPEGILAEATWPSRNRDSETDKRPGVAVPPWGVSSPAINRAVDSGSDEVEEPRGFFSFRVDGSWLKIPLCDSTTIKLVKELLGNMEMAPAVLPTEAEWAFMRDMYLRKIQPIFPIFDKETLLDLPAHKKIREAIQAAVCLAISTDPEVHGRLTLGSRGPDGEGWVREAVGYEDYSQALANFINKRIKDRELPLVYNLQVMCITCLYWQPEEVQERSAPLNLFGVVASIAASHGVHLELLGKGHLADQSTPGSGKRLFKCIYALDRLISAFSGRPVMFHNEDLMDKPRDDPEDPPSFRLFMSLIGVLDQVIEMYHPRPTVTYIDIPVYEQMALDVGAQCEPEMILTTLEILYHAIGVLSVRMTRERFATAPENDGNKAVTPGSYQHLPPSSLNARRSHSSDRILDVITAYKFCPFPFVPYALSLSLSVAYRKMRFSKLPMFRVRGKADFLKVAAAMREFCPIWAQARLSSELGNAVVRNLERGEALLRERARTNGGLCAPSKPKTTNDDGSAFNIELHSRARWLIEKPDEGAGPDSTRSAPTATSVSLQASHIPPPAFEIPSPSLTLVNPPQSLSEASAIAAGSFNASISGLGQQNLSLFPTAGADQVGSSSGDFTAVNDSLIFDSWDPTLAQMIDYSFASNLDPGNPFGSCEYMGFT